VGTQVDLGTASQVIFTKRRAERLFFSNSPDEPYVFETGFAHDADLVGAFEAPSLSAALAGTVRLERAGWARRFATEWLLGPREFSTVHGRGERTDHSWGFLALWEWNYGDKRGESRS